MVIVSLALGSSPSSRVVQLKIDVLVLRRRRPSDAAVDRRLQGVRHLPCVLRLGSLRHLPNTVEVAMLGPTGLLASCSVNLAARDCGRNEIFFGRRQRQLRIVLLRSRFSPQFLDGLGEQGHLVLIILSDVVSLPLGEFFRLQSFANFHTVLFFHNFCCNQLVSLFNFIKVIHGFCKLSSSFPVFSVLGVFGYESGATSLILDYC